MARDPNRIPEMLAALEAAWRRNPDWRLGQVVVNAMPIDWPSSDMFHVEDEDMLNGLLELVEVYR